MGIVQIILAALALGGAEPLLVETAVPKAEVRSEKSQQRQLGSESVPQIRDKYQKQEYKQMLDELEISYREVRENDGLKNLAEMRIGPIQGQDSWEKLMKDTLAERNLELQSAVSGDNSTLAAKVASATTPLDSDVDEALTRLGELHMLAPGQGVNADENKLIDIDFEYEYKALHLDMPLMMGQKVEGLREKQIALKMEQMEKMLEASKSFQDASLVKAVQTVHSNLDPLLVQNWDTGDLNGLTRTAQSPVEEKIASILMKYREKFTTLSKEFMEKQVVIDETN